MIILEPEIFAALCAVEIAIPVGYDISFTTGNQAQDPDD